MSRTEGKEILTIDQLRDWASSKEHDIAQPLVEASENAMDMLKNLGVAARAIQESTVIANLNQTIDFALRFAPQALAASTAVLKMMEAPGQVSAGEIRRIATSSMAGRPDDLPASVLKGLVPGTADFRRWGTRNTARDTRLFQAEQIHSREILPALQIFDELAYQAEQAITVNKNAGDTIEEHLKGMPAIRMDAQRTATEHDGKAKEAEEAFVIASEQSLPLAISRMGIIQDDSELDTLLKQLVESRIRSRDHRIKATEATARRDRATIGIITSSMDHEAVTIVHDDSIHTANSLTLAWEILQAGHDLSLTRLCCAISREERQHLWAPQLKATGGIITNAQKRLAEPEMKNVN